LSEEFANFIEKLSQESLENQVIELKKIVLSAVEIIQKLIDNFNSEFTIIHTKISSLEVENLHKEVVNQQNPLIALPPPPPPPSENNKPKPMGKEFVRSAIIDELKTFFKKSYEKNGSGSE